MGFPLSCAWVQVRWFELPPMMIFHVANAWQEGDLVKVFACCFEEVRALWLPGPSGERRRSFTCRTAYLFVSAAGDIPRP